MKRTADQASYEVKSLIAPHPRLARILAEATAASELMAQANSFAKRFPAARYWPDRQWDLAVPLLEALLEANHTHLPRFFGAPAPVSVDG